VRRLAGDHAAAGVALELIRPADPELSSDRQEPAADPLGIGHGVPHVVDRAWELAAQTHRATVAGSDAALPDLALHRSDLPNDVDHVVASSWD
jgi:hypothetical protein